MKWNISVQLVAILLLFLSTPTHAEEGELQILSL